MYIYEINGCLVVAKNLWEAVRRITGVSLQRARQESIVKIKRFGKLEEDLSNF